MIDVARGSITTGLGIIALAASEAPVMPELSGLAIIGGFVLIVIGLLQYLVAITKRNDRDREKIIEALEKEKIENAKLKARIVILESMLEQNVTKNKQ